MPLVLYTGDDYPALAHERDSRAAALSAHPERINAATDPQGVIAAVGSPSLFADSRTVLIDNLDALDDKTFSALASRLESSTAQVFAHTTKVRPAMKALATEVVTCRKPAQHELPQYLQKYARQRGVKLSSQSLQLLKRTCRDNPSWARQIINVCALVNITAPTPSQVQLLLGDRKSAPRLWEIPELPPQDMVHAAYESDPFPLISFLRTRILDSHDKTTEGMTATRKKTAALLAKNTAAHSQLSRNLTTADDTARGGNALAGLLALLVSYRTALQTPEH